MKTMVAIYTARGNVEALTNLFKTELPDVRVFNIIDDSIIPELIESGSVTPSVRKRILSYYGAAELIKPDLILTTCSSIGDIAELGHQLIDHPAMMRIDEGMAIQAVQNYQRIGVLATLETTLDPTVRLIQHKAEQFGREVKVYSGLAKGAYQALRGGDPEKHDAMIRQTAMELASEVDVFLLAQASMARAGALISQEIGKPIYTSPEYCIPMLKQFFSC